MKHITDCLNDENSDDSFDESFKMVMVMMLGLMCLFCVFDKEYFIKMFYSFKTITV